MENKDLTNRADKIIKSAMAHEVVNELLRELSHYDEYTFWHSVSVARMSLVLGMAIGLTEDRLYQLAYGALLHDIGKMDVPIDIIHKQDSLTGFEAAILKRHPQNGAKRVDVYKKLPEEVLDAILDHHENYDGSGYPNGKAREALNDFARIIRICDTYDAMADDRPYKKGLSMKSIYTSLKRGRGFEYDPDLVHVFLSLKDHGKISNHTAKREKEGLISEDAFQQAFA